MGHEYVGLNRCFSSPSQSISLCWRLQSSSRAPAEMLLGDKDDLMDVLLRDTDVMTGKDDMYQPIRFIGRGTFGRVYQCRRLKNVLEDDVAVKIQVQTCRREVSVLRRLVGRDDNQQCNVVSHLLEEFMHRDKLCLVLELMPTDLWTLLQDRFPTRSLSVSRTRCIVKELLVALAWLQQNGVIHGDIKMDNVLVDPFGPRWRVKLADFGRALFVEEASKFRGVTMQIPYYRAPEVILGASITPAVDMWSLGCLAANLHMGVDNYLFPADLMLVQLHLIVDLLGHFPKHLLLDGIHARKYFTRDFRLKSCAAVKKMFAFSKEWRGFEDLEELSSHQFVSFLHESLNVDPMRRVSPSAALASDFFTDNS